MAAPARPVAAAVIGPTALETDEEAMAFQSLRPRLFGIAYRMLGRVAEAEDVVQDVWVRWHGADRAQVRDRVAFLVTITTRVALNVAVSARARYEIPVDSWLAERIPTSDNPTVAVERSVDLEDAVRLLLERLSPIERAVFVLREAFEYPFREIAEALEISDVNARQLGRRARQHLAEQRPEPDQPAECNRLFRAFLHAARIGDVAGLERVLVDDVISHSGRNVRIRRSPFGATGAAEACGGAAVAVHEPELRGVVAGRSGGSSCSRHRADQRSRVAIARSSELSTRGEVRRCATAPPTCSSTAASAITSQLASSSGPALSPPIRDHLDDAPRPE
jgi:RNA polymerase sigma factor (sigma-70 family)